MSRLVRNSGRYARTMATVALWMVPLLAACDGGETQSQDTDDTSFSLVAVEVTRGDLTSEKEFDGTVTHGEKWNLTTVANGTVTFSQPEGTVVDFGEPLIAINDQPIILAKGPAPIYREMFNVEATAGSADGETGGADPVDDVVAGAAGADGEITNATPAPTTTTIKLDPIEGDDVTQLQEFLISQGFDLGGRMQADGNFGAQTEEAVKAWQKSLGRPQTGRVDSAQLVFAPRRVRIETDIRVGALYEGLEVTPANPAITVTTSNRDRQDFTINEEVTIIVDDGSGDADGDGDDVDDVDSTLVGTVTKQESVVDEFQETSWQTTINPDAALPPTVNEVTVVVTEVAATDALLVPVSALVALAEGGFAVEIVDGSTQRLVAVELDEVLESTAAISGDLEAGDEVLIPE